MTRTVIPKDCLVCDVCNAQLTDDHFIANEDCVWHEGWLYCMNCEYNYKPKMKIIMRIKKGDNLSKTDLALPIIFEDNIEREVIE